jgi:hypothetical protein
MLRSVTLRRVQKRRRDTLQRMKAAKQKRWQAGGLVTVAGLTPSGSVQSSTTVGAAGGAAVARAAHADGLSAGRASDGSDVTVALVAEPPQADSPGTPMAATPESTVVATGALLRDASPPPVMNDSAAAAELAACAAAALQAPVEAPQAQRGAERQCIALATVHGRANVQPPQVATSTAADTARPGTTVARPASDSGQAPVAGAVVATKGPQPDAEEVVLAAVDNIAASKLKAAPKRRAAPGAQSHNWLSHAGACVCLL